MTSSTAPMVMLVDDEQDLLAMLADHFKDDGKYATATAPTAKAALEIMKSWASTSQALGLKCIVSDMMMPEMTGEQFLAEVRKSVFKSVPFVIMSGALDAEGAKRLMANGVDGIIFKPFTPEKLFKEIEMARTRREAKEMKTLLGQ